MGVTFKDEKDQEGFQDILSSGGIYRKPLVTTEGEKPEFNEEVEVKYSVWVQETNENIVDDRTRTFRVGDGDVMPALELVAKMLRVGEINEVRCEGRFCVGESAVKDRVPQDTQMKLKVHLLRVGKRTTYDMSASELMEEARKKKETGNGYFKEKNYEQAGKVYKRAIKILGMGDFSAPDDMQKCKELLVAIGNNVANVQQRTGELKEARESCNEVLQLDPDNTKAIYRLGSIAIDESEFTEATAHLRRVLALEPKNTGARKLMKEMKAKKKQFKEREQKLYAKLGGDKKEGGQPVMKVNPAFIMMVLTGVISIAMYMYLGQREI